jgi:hypothetical protein
MLRGLVGLIHANPAVSAALVSILGAAVAKLGFHLNAAEIAWALGALNTLLMAWVHGKVTPVAKLAKPAEPPAA